MFYDIETIAFDESGRQKVILISCVKVMDGLISVHNFKDYDINNKDNKTVVN